MSPICVLPFAVNTEIRHGKAMFRRISVDRDFCGLYGIADFEHFALIIERDAFAAECGSQIVNVQDTETMAFNRCLKVRGRLVK